ncbi:hypothetical protein SRHO_G00051050 [Serrasalmus rhombeus]
MTACKAMSEACQLTTSLCHPQTPTCAISKWHMVCGGLLPDGPMMAVAGVLHPADSSPQAVCKWSSLISHSQTKTDGSHSLLLGSLKPQPPSYKRPLPDLLTQEHDHCLNAPISYDTIKEFHFQFRSSRVNAPMMNYFIKRLVKAKNLTVGVCITARKAEALVKAYCFELHH